MNTANASQYYEIPVDGGVPIKAWTRGAPFGEETLLQVQNIARLPIISGWVAVMPDVHWGIGTTVGSVIPTKGAIIPAAVGVDIGCGMMAVKTSLRAGSLPENLEEIRGAIERAVPHGRSSHGGRGDAGSWRQGEVPRVVWDVWQRMKPGLDRILEKHPKARPANTANHLGTLGTGNHFIEMCIDENDYVWFMLHSGSRGPGSSIGTYFIELARRDMGEQLGSLPDQNLAYLTEGTLYFREYVEAVRWAQGFASINRQVMMATILETMKRAWKGPPFNAQVEVVNCHHNYVAQETHFGEEIFVTRKGAVRARKGDLGIIPGSMGARSYIVRGKGNLESFQSCSHGAGRLMSRTDAQQRFTVDDHIRATAGVECRKDVGVLDETPGAYKDIGAVMKAQDDLVEIVHTLRQVVCVKG